MKFKSLALILVLAAVATADQTLFDFSANPDTSKVEPKAATSFELIDLEGGKAVQVKTTPDNPYPGIRFQAANGTWDLGKFTGIQIVITNLDNEGLKLGARVDNKGATGQDNSNSGSVTIAPGKTGTITVNFNRRFAEEIRDQLKGMQYSPWGKNTGMIDPAKITELNIFLNRPHKNHVFAVRSIKAVGTFDPASLTVPQPFFPFVDEFGQYTHSDWPGKIHSDADLKAVRDEEAKSMHDQPRPANWDEFGGWANGPQLKATGHFYTAKHDGKWWLVTPKGTLFFSMGITCVQNKGGATVIEQRPNWFAKPIWEKEPFTQFVNEGKAPKRGDYKDQTLKTFSFYSSNLYRKYGDDWQSQWYQLIGQRLMNWGINTIANWSDAKLFENSKTPYTHWVFINTPKLPWAQGYRNRIPDPFNPMFEQDIRRRGTNMLRGTTDDPMCIGYFLDNEITWNTETSPAELALLGNKKNAATTTLINFLTDRYKSINKLNTAWDADYSNFDAIRGTKKPPASTQGHKDMLDFSEIIVDKYFSTVKRVLKEIAPNKLYLGCRFAENNPLVLRIAAKYADVVSFNLYRDNVEGWKPPVEIDKPVIIGEFHFGSTDRGVFGPGLIGVASQKERVETFKNYVRSAIDNPQIVGAHWFQLLDEPTSGRPLDEENHQIGFLTITDTPYMDMVQAARENAMQMYQSSK
jgi:hypothetical protein